VKCGLSPLSRYNGLAKFASIPVQVIDGNLISDPFNQKLFTIMAISVVYFGIYHVAHIDIADPLAHGQFAELEQGRKRGGRQAVEFVSGGKA
jgi:hypothetical protein